RSMVISSQPISTNDYVFIVIKYHSDGNCQQISTSFAGNNFTFGYAIIDKVLTIRGGGLMNENRVALTAEQRQQLIHVLEARFMKNMHRHEGIDWANVRDKLMANTDKL